MGFFDQVPVLHVETESRPEPARPMWFKAEDVLPTTVALDLVMAHTEAVAIGLSALTCYPNGFEFAMQAVLREPDRRRRLFAHTHYMLEPGEPIPPEMLRIGLQFSDGTKLTNLPRQFPHRGHAEPNRPIMLGGGGGGGDRSYSYQNWVWPLPPPGPLTFVCEWPHFHIGETQATVDAQVVLDAAARAVPLWPN